MRWGPVPPCFSTIHIINLPLLIIWDTWSSSLPTWRSFFFFLFAFLISHLCVSPCAVESNWITVLLQFLLVSLCFSSPVDAHFLHVCVFPTGLLCQPTLVEVGLWVSSHWQSCSSLLPACLSALQVLDTFCDFYVNNMTDPPIAVSSTTLDRKNLLIMIHWEGQPFCFSSSSSNAVFSSHKTVLKHQVEHMIISVSHDFGERQLIDESFSQVELDWVSPRY